MAKGWIIGLAVDDKVYAIQKDGSKRVVARYSGSKKVWDEKQRRHR
ncbi:hypothetical protein Nitsa_1205 [Nitratifractor salsuginis DSM 16511]|uniref:Uncharacterized protein n=1 Tax=Nitratifractor salsuginis (strain DSM 16511 / JCM 12458 / E9I37-1) TaxID=749222 RepID=E6WYE6_NITSE|nr:hypothetical protein Nitsa_1205 [Nitratifractor salsuginis DSM 16511]